MQGGSQQPGVTRLLAWLMVLVLVIVGLVTVLPGALFALSYLISDVVHPKCTDADRAAWASVDHYVALEPRANPEVIGCMGVFGTQDEASAVIDHYQEVLVADGWRILERRDLDPSMTPPPAPSAEGTIPQAMPAMDALIRAGRDGYQITVHYQQGWAGLAQADGTTDWRLSRTVWVTVGPISQ